MKQKLKNNQRGITLVALVITIIVLLILAMVSIKIAIDGGLIGKSNEAVTVHEEAKTKESVQLAVARCYMTKEGLTAENLKKALKEQKIEVEEDNINLEDKKVTIDGKEYELEEKKNNNNSTTEEKSWFNFTEEEVSIAKKYQNEVTDDTIIANNEKYTKIIDLFITKKNKIGGILILNSEQDKMISFFTEDIYDGVTSIPEGDIKELNKWYTYGGSGYVQIDKYNGECPIEISELKVEDGCESIVQKILKGF